MLRTNNFFLSFIEQLYSSQSSKAIALRKYPKGTLVYNQNQACFRVTIIKSGFVKCFYTEDNDKEFIFEFLGSGEIIGEIEAIKKIKCLCNIEAVSDVEAYTFPISFFISLIEKDAEFREAVLLELVERLINTSHRASFQKAYSSKYGLLRLMYMQQKQNISISKSDMASYLGIDIRSLNRALEQIRKADNINRN
jgi:CRP-like cAMP-binding protein